MAIFAIGIGETSQDQAFSISVDSSGNNHVIDTFNNTVDFDPGTGTTNVTSVGSIDGNSAKYSSTGTLSYAFQIGETGLDLIFGNAVDSSGNTYVTGQYSATVDFDPGAGTSNLTSSGGSDIFLAKYDSSGGFVWSTNSLDRPGVIKGERLP